MRSDFIPTRAAGLARLAGFLPFAGDAYTQGRNYDAASGQVSRLSPYLRRRLVLEAEAVQAALDCHGPIAARKFIEEVMWRTYWKGWLEQHPSVWRAYRHDLAQLRQSLKTDAALCKGYRAGVEGRTGIACFDAWAVELQARNWLHNHARMWFASIWIFTLRLPWQLGADFFLTHLLDGDPASNTLSWRWVAGLQGSGKPYVATAQNIARFTEGRFNPRGELNEAPAPLTESCKPKPVALRFDPPPEGDVALLVHDDDCAPETSFLEGIQPKLIASFMPDNSEVSAPVAAFTAAARDDAARRAAAFFGCGPAHQGALAEWARETGLPVVTAYPPVGPVADALAASGVPLHRVIRGWDQTIWPYSARGFFYLRKRLPGLLRKVQLL